MSEVDEQFAWDEGEGDRTLKWWTEAHVRFFARLGIDVGKATEMVLERFELVWPVDSALTSNVCRVQGVQ